MKFQLFSHDTVRGNDTASTNWSIDEEKTMTTLDMKVKSMKNSTVFVALCGKQPDDCKKGQYKGTNQYWTVHLSDKWGNLGDWVLCRCADTNNLPCTQ